MEKLDGLIEDLRSRDESRAQAAILKIAAYGQRAIPVLSEMLASPDSDVRWWATWAISEIPAPEAPGLLRQMLSDPEETVQECAALALRQQPSIEAIPELVECLKSKNSTLANLAGAALTAAGPGAVGPLIDVLENGPEAARLLAARALAQIGDIKSIPILMDALNQDSALLEYWASEGLDRMGLGTTFFNT